MNKKRIAGLFLAFLMLSSFIFLSISLVSAQTPVSQKDAEAFGYINPEYASEAGITQEYLNSIGYESSPNTPATQPATQPSPQKTATTSVGKFFQDRYNLWLGGYNSKNFDVNLAGEFVKIILLFTIVVLIYSAMSYSGFIGEKNEFSFMRLILAILVGVLSTFLITTQQLMTSLISFTALGVTLMIFFPILALGFFTILVSSTASPFGIFIQKILWLIYSVYLFISGIVLTVLLYAKDASGDWARTITQYVINPLYGGADSTIITNMRASADGPTAIILLVVAVAVFVIAVAQGKFLVHWLAKEKRDADLLKHQDELERQIKKRQMEANSTR